MRHSASVVSPRDEDPTNFWPVDFAVRAVVSNVLRLGIPANAISIGGFVVGAFAALMLARASNMAGILLSFALSALWLLADSLDGMVARARGTASAIGRELDGLCDHGVFLLLYVALAWSTVSLTGRLVLLAAAVAHVVQANLYEAERTRFKQRTSGASPALSNRTTRNPLVRAYDACAALLAAGGEPFDRALAMAHRPKSLLGFYRAHATRGFRTLTALSADVRILILYAARLLGSPRAFCWIEIGPMSAATVIGILWHRSIERAALATAGEARR